MNVRLSKEQKIKILNTESVYKIMQQVLLRENVIRRGQEHFWVIGLNNANKILFVELVALGADNRVYVKPTQVFKMAIYKAATKMILVHNHPSGNMLASQEDVSLTDKFLKIGLLIELEVIDHLIISETEYISFLEMGIIEKLKVNGEFEIVNRFDAEIKNLKIEKEKKSAVKEAKIEMAKALIKLNAIPIDAIRKTTGLTIREINKIIKENSKNKV